MRARCIKVPAECRAAAGSRSDLLRVLPIGEEFEILHSVGSGKDNWVAIRTQDGMSGYIKGETPIFEIRRYRSNQDALQVYADPRLQEMTGSPLPAGTNFEITAVLGQDAVEIRDGSGRVGYVPGSVKATRIDVPRQPVAARPAPMNQQSIGARNMWVGGLWFVGGTMVTMLTYSAAASGNGGGTYFVAWGAILFGGIQFLKGVVQCARA